MVSSLCLNEPIMTLAANICSGGQWPKFDPTTNGRPTCMIDALVVQVSQARASLPQYIFLTEREIALVLTSCRFLSRKGYMNMRRSTSTRAGFPSTSGR